MSVYNLDNNLSSRISQTLFNRNFMECPCREHSQEYSLLRKRLKYKSDRDFLKPQDLFADLANFILMAEVKYDIDLETSSTEQLQKTHLHHSARGLMWSLIESIEDKPNNLPLYKIPSPTLKHFLHTRFSEQVILQHLQPTITQGLLLLPINSSTNFYDLNWIYFEYDECQCDNPNCHIGGVHCVSVVEGMVFFATQLILNRSPLHFTVNTWHTSIAGLKRFQTLFNPNCDPLLFQTLQTETNLLFDRWDNKIEIDHFCYFVTTVVLNFLMFSQTYPDALQLDSLATKGFGKKSQKKSLVPTHTLVLPQGKTLNFTIDSQQQNITPHWRCGHWRNQPFGSRNDPQYRLQWIEPVWVTGNQP